MLNPNGARDAAKIDRANKRRRSIGVDTDYSEEDEWPTTAVLVLLILFVLFISY